MATCTSCDEPLVLEVDLDSEDEDLQSGTSSHAAVETVPDDVELACGDHFHWQCLLDAYTVTECPHCAKPLATNSADGGGQQILCTVRNEGGIQENLDILPILTEEGYLKTFPEERKARAFLEFCKEGDLEAIVGLVKDHYDAGSDEGDVDVLRYQDSLGNMTSGLHAAVHNGQEEVAWLLLLLGSNLDWSSLPAPVLQAAHDYGLSKNDRHGEPDIRSLQDSHGHTAGDAARSLGGIWSAWIESGRLNP